MRGPLRCFSIWTQENGLISNVPAGCNEEALTGSAPFVLPVRPLRPVRTRIREEYELHGVEAYAYLHDITIAAHDISPGTVEVIPFLVRELTERGVHLNPGKTIALDPKGNVLTPEDVSLLAGVGVRILGEGGVKVVGISVGTDDF